ncbi:MAG: septum formation initiator family protein [Clostridia bacterium]|nr:septum formation initiator family protein [Clostridia bacterium]
MSAAKRKPSRKRKSRSRILVLAVLVFAVYVVVMLTQLQMELDERKEVLADINRQITEKQRFNEDLENKLADPEKNLEEQARKQGWARPGEIIFQEIPGIQ